MSPMRAERHPTKGSGCHGTVLRTLHVGNPGPFKSHLDTGFFCHLKHLGHRQPKKVWHRDPYNVPKSDRIPNLAVSRGVVHVQGVIGVQPGFHGGRRRLG